MTRPVKTQKRPYNSKIRAEQAKGTRRRVIAAAYDLFTQRGYAGTTIAAIAAESGVVEETIYGSFGTKRALLESVIDETIMGPSAPMPLPQQLALEQIEKLPTPKERLRAYVAFACKVLARTSPVHAVIRGAADAEASFVDVRKRLLAERVASNEDQLQKCVGKAFRRGLTANQAVEHFAGLTSPELYYLLTVDLGWSPKQHEDWLAEVVERDLLGT